jgi:multidrug efflux pump subunit AcrA (membrane-fusion protein)
MRNKKLWILLAVLIIAAGLLGFYFQKNPSSGGLRLGKVAKEDLIQRVTIAGMAEANKTTIVASSYDGYIKKLYVSLGDQIEMGQPLVSIAQSLQAAENVFPIRAPFSGTVTQVMKSEGQYVKTGDAKDYIIRMDDLSKMFINANAPEMDVVKLKPGLETIIRVSAILDRTYKGSVTSISQAATSNEQWGGRSQVNFMVKIQVTDADKNLKPGMSAIIDIVTNKKPGVLTLAHEFIQKKDEKYFVILKDGKRRDIKVGLQNETAFEILEGLKEGDEVRQVDFLKLIEKEDPS